MGVFLYQYFQYKRIEDRLSAAYSTTYSGSQRAYNLFSTFSEAENLFRMYTVDFNKESFDAYKEKLNTIKGIVDSIASLPIENNPLVKGGLDLESYQTFALEFAVLKKDIDHLVTFASDSLQMLAGSEPPPSRTYSIQDADSLIRQIMQDTTDKDLVRDTIIKEKQGLIRRIFNTKNDTLVSDHSYEILNTQQRDIVHRNIEQFILANERSYGRNLRHLRQKFLKMQSKERELVLANYTLLNNLKTGLDRLKQLETDKIRKIEERDFAIYRANFAQFGWQLVTALIIMLLMVVFIVYYHIKVASFEKKLFLEKEYAAKIAEEKTSVLANISHEIRTPLNSLKGLITLLKKSDKENTIDKEMIQTVDNDISVINTTINDILNLSKLEAGSLEIKQDYFSPYQVIEDTINLHQYQAKTKGLKYSYENKVQQDIEIYCNAFRIKQVISNLITNAIKYTPKGSVHIRAYFSTANNKEKLIVDITDTGIGISDSKKDQVFRKYYRVDGQNKSKTTGFGLGLYISKILSEQIGGIISFTSKPGIGSTFTFELPVTEKIVRDKIEPDAATIADLPENLNIVIIDDSRISIFFVQQMFKNRKEGNHFFQSSAQAWEFIQSHTVDVIITDLIMPGIDGWEILSRIKSDAALSSIKVFACTAEPMLLEDERNKTYAFDGRIAKPINESELVSTVIKSAT
ncbi:hybrid sensor histidine kinase/response regulator [Sphingobacterium sp. SGG-5]|uniref:ATP-binding response regulator n=1 Tax=Sphingobacterium sp. SGG-5 TaxID=2710881 RepID=UPI0019D0F7E9|nr:ATP-binding protein [Sphingobacterium sp. SGG-5]